MSSFRQLLKLTRLFKLLEFEYEIPKRRKIDSNIRLLNISSGTTIIIRVHQVVIFKSVSLDNNTLIEKSNNKSNYEVPCLNCRYFYITELSEVIFNFFSDEIRESKINNILRR